MKQTINLLPLQPLVVRNWLAFNYVLAVFGLTIIALLCTGSWFWWQTSNIKLQNAQQLSQNISDQSQIETITAALDKRQIPYKLSIARTQLQQQVKAMQQMLDMIAQADLPNSVGFLASVDSIHISLPESAQVKQFTIGAQQNLISLKGSVANVKDIPLLIQDLRDNDVRYNQNTSRIDVQNAGDYHSFEILSQSGASDK